MSITLSVLLHGALLAALVYGWMLFRQPPRPAPTLAIEARVVDARAVPGAPAPPAPQPPPPAAAPPVEPPPEAAGPPQPTPEELAQREQQRERAERAAAEAQRAADEKAAEEKAAQEKAAKEKAAKEKAAKEAAERQAQERAQRLAEAEESSEAEADLKRSLAAEQASAARSGPALANWQSMITAKIKSNWFRPPTARSGIECVLYVTQVPGGEVTQVRIGPCNGDPAVRQSIEDAVYRASPLPAPPDPALFDRNLKIDFKPD